MMNSSDSWMAGARSWLAAPCTYTTAKCLSSRVHALQVGHQPRPSVWSFHSWPPGGEAAGLCRPQERALINRRSPGLSEGAGRLGTDPVHSAGLRLGSEGDVAGLRRHGSPGAAAQRRQPRGPSPRQLHGSSVRAAAGRQRKADTVSFRSLLGSVNAHAPDVCSSFRRWKTWREK